MTFEELHAQWDWRPIRNCPGRFVRRGGASTATPAEIVGEDVELREFRVANAVDPVVVIRFDDGGGLISYQKPDGRFLHTLNTPEGFARKLAQFGIEL
ncbi:MAG: hypothetical protein JSS81_16130 [Acidobacteria bacterium]|nr:hypothetical protein [Acidobacteriota bacterium]